MVYLKLIGIVLAKEKIKENDANVYILTKKDGIMKIYAKGLFQSKSKNLSLMETGNWLQLYLFSKNEKLHLISSLPLKTKYLFFEKYPLIYLSVFKLIKKLEIIETPEFLWQVLEKLDFYIRQNPENFFHWFIYHFLTSLGYEPEIEKCFKCNKKLQKNIFFDNKLFLYCSQCKKDAYLKIKEDDFKKALKIKDEKRVPKSLPKFLKIILKNFLIKTKTVLK